MDKKTIPILILLAVVIIFYWPILEFLGLYKPEPPKAPAELADSTQVVTTSPATSPLETAPVGAIPTVLTPAVPVQDTLSIDTIRVITNTYEAVLTTLGGGPISLILKNYTYRDGSPIQMLPEAQRATPECRFAGSTFSTSQLHFACNLPAGSYEVTGDPLDVVFTYTAESGGIIERKLTFHPDTHHFDLVLSVPEPAKIGLERSYDLVWNTPLQPTEPSLTNDYTAFEVAAMLGGSREKLDDFKDDVLNQRIDGDATWAGVRSKYFAAILIPRNRHADVVVAQGDNTPIDTETGMVDRKRLIGGLGMPISSFTPIADTFTVFCGPLDYMMMAEYGVDLEDMLDIGTTPVVGWLIKPFAIGIIWLLPRLYDFVPNYGLVIIIFAILIKLITLPLSLKSFKSMQAMKDLQPHMEEMKERFKKDPQKLNQEMMKLYKKHGVNPLSGCLVMLPQMPIFFALFSVFQSTILLRDAPFVWFITDLSRGAQDFTDPYMILVLLMVAAQFVSQKYTMASTQQNKMFMYILPVVIGFFFRTVAAGLVLYWTSFSILTLADFVIFRRSKNAEVKTA